MHAIFGVPPAGFDYKQSTLFDAAHPDDRHILTDAAERYQETGIPELLKYRIVRPDGQVRHVWAYGETLERADGETIARGYVLDVTDRVRVETGLRGQRDALAAEQDARLYALVHGSPVPACIHSEDGELLLVNARWTELSGYRPEETPTMRDWTQKAYADNAEAVRKGIESLFELNDAKDEGEFEVTTKDGNKRRWLFSSAPAGVLQDGRKVVVSMAHDITVQRQLEEERKRHEQELFRAQKMESLGVLAGGVAHDFNNLLTAVIGNASVAETATPAGSELHTLLKRITEAAERAAALSRDMLTYAGKRALSQSAIHVDACVSEMRSLLRSSVSRRHHIRIALSAGEAAAVLGANELGQVVMNLVGNAADAMLDSSGHITIRTGIEQLAQSDLRERHLGHDAQPGAFTYVEVEDDGVGMDEETAARAFEPFFTSKATGRGLGMAIILGVLKNAGGVAEIDTAPGRGTRIRVSFPLSEADPGTTRPADPGADTSTRSGRILLVDDEPLVRDSLSAMLDLLGYDVVVAESGSRALATFDSSEHPFDAAVVDLTMPDMSGVEVLRALKERSPGLPVVLTTGYSQSDLPAASDSVRHDALLTKPFRVEELGALLDQVMGAPG
jgi:PAS domain S-box-containing protein